MTKEILTRMVTLIRSRLWASQQQAHRGRLFFPADQESLRSTQPRLGRSRRTRTELESHIPGQPFPASLSQEQEKPLGHVPGQPSKPRTHEPAFLWFKMSSTGDANNLASDAADGAPTSTTIDKEVCGSPSRKRQYKTRADVWEHMTKIKFDKNRKAEKARCKYCHQEYCCVSTNGTSTLRKHILNCKKYPFNERNKGQQSLSFQSTGRGEGSTNKLLNWCFNQERSRIAFAKMIITDELPFRFIEREGFRHFMSVTQPEFKLCREIR